MPPYEEKVGNDASSSDFSNPIFTVGQDGACNAQILTTNDAWDKRSNVVTSDEDQKIKIKYVNKTIEIYCDKELVMTLASDNTNLLFSNDLFEML